MEYYKNIPKTYCHRSKFLQPPMSTHSKQQQHKEYANILIQYEEKRIAKPAPPPEKPSLSANYLQQKRLVDMQGYILCNWSCPVPSFEVDFFPRWKQDPPAKNYNQIRCFFKAFSPVFYVILLSFLTLFSFCISLLKCYILYLIKYSKIVCQKMRY